MDSNVKEWMKQKSSLKAKDLCVRGWSMMAKRLDQKHFNQNGSVTVELHGPFIARERICFQVGCIIHGPLFVLWFKILHL